MKKLTLLYTALFSLASSTYALASEEVVQETASEAVVAPAQESAKGFYIGVGYGTFESLTDSDWDDDYRYGKLANKTSGNTSKVYAGYQFNRIIGVEVSYSDYGNTSGFVYNGSAQPVHQSPTALSVAANAGYSFNNGWRAFGILGLSSVDLNSSYAYLDTDSPSAIRWGGGGEYTPAGLKGFQLRVAFEADTYFAEADRIFSSDDDIYAFTLMSLYVGASYKF